MNDSNAVRMDEEGGLQEIQSASEPKFTAEMQSLINRAEEFRLRKMRAYSGRNSVALIFGLLSILAGAGGFGWFFLVKGQIFQAVLCMAGAIIMPVLLNLWAKGPLTAYKREFKGQFMPAVARALGGLTFHPRRGIGEKILKSTGIVPPYDVYHAEDCFMGRYSGVKVILSEARLSSKRQKDYVFDGIFVFLEIPKDTFSGTTVITADRAVAQAVSRSLQPLPISNPVYASQLSMMSSKPDQAAALQSDTLLKEIHEMAVLFDNAPLSAVFFRKKYIFMMIPYAQDMFESSNIFLPVTTKGTALQCKKEIDQILSIIDVLDIYKA